MYAKLCSDGRTSPVGKESRFRCISAERIDCRRRKALVLRAFRGLSVCLSLFTCARSVRCGMEGLTSARVSNRGHQAAELGCGRLRRCPVIRPATNQGVRDTPYDRRRTLTAAYRAGACLSLDDFPAVSSQRLFTQPLFLDLRRSDFGALSFFLRYRGGGKCRDKIVSKNAGRIFLPFRLHTILSAFAVLFNSGGRPIFPGGFILTYFGFLIRAKSC